MTDKTAIVIGAGSGMGLALARTFASEGYAIALIARDTTKLGTLLDALASAGYVARSYVADVTDATQLRSAIDAATGLGTPEVLLYNAAAVQQDSATQLDTEEFATTLATNVVGAKTAVDAVLPLLPSGGGSLLFTGGGFALEPQRDFASLSIGKAALRAFVLALAQELQPRGVHVGTVTITGTVDGDDPHYAASEIAQAFLDLHHQPNNQWTAETVY